MKRQGRLSNGVMSLVPRAGEYLEGRPDVEFAYLFGGLARRGRVTPLSDVDIAVYLSAAVPVARAKLEIVGALIDILRTDAVDLVVLNGTPISLSGRILKDRKVIAERNPFRRHAYESLVMMEYFDFAIRERAILEGRYLHG